MTPPGLLAFDTATEVCSVALLHGDSLSSRSAVVGQRHSEHALPMADALLQERGLQLRDLDAIAFGAGPGSFTGLRIACGLAQGLAWGAALPVVAIGNLQALAARFFALDAEAGSVLCAIDARMQEAYCAIYRRGQLPLEVQAPTLVARSALASLAREVDAVAGNALIAFADAWSGTSTGRRQPELCADATDIVRIAALPTVLATAVPPAQAAPLYVRDHVALTTDERRVRAELQP
jgi:tRNA threonylcarbamoyladenosine biosynthesis protein TsaB